MASIDANAVDELVAGFDGKVILPDDPDYDEARKVFNGMVDKRPAVVARCSSTEDVVSAVSFGRNNELEVAVRCGGHSAAGMSICDGGVLIDLSGMKEIEVDPDAKTARCGGGTLTGEFDEATQAHGLAAPLGRVTTTGVGGFTLGGGYGWLSSKFGLASDNLISAEVVVADGSVLTASEDENEDLFWGIRGGGGNFGVVTSFEFKLHEVGPLLYAGLAAWPVERAPEVLRAWRDHVEGAPDELCTACVILTGPPEEFVPEHLQGQPMLGLAGCYIGDPADGEKAFAPLKQLEPDMDLIQPMPYTAFQAVLDPGNQPGFRNYWRGEYMDGVSDEAIDTFVSHCSPPASPLTQLLLFRLGGEVSRIADDATAFSHRDAPYMFHPIGMWEAPDDDERMISWVKDLSETMGSFTSDSVYLNFTADQGEDRVRAGFGDAKYERLVALKDKYDPENLFRLNQNIKPSGKAPAAA